MSGPSTAHAKIAGEPSIPAATDGGGRGVGRGVAEFGADATARGMRQRWHGDEQRDEQGERAVETHGHDSSRVLGSLFRT